MNRENIQQVISHYIENFDRINSKDNNETYKWKIAKDFRGLMDEALAADEKDFADILYKAKAATQNLIDSYTQPFHGLVEYARREPATVKQMFLDLYADDGGDFQTQEKLIATFLERCQVLQEKYFPGSYRYKQNSHSVSSYLFLYDPEHHYMYKATQAAAFADCAEYYDSWGTGDNIHLKPFYRLCDELIAEIKKCDELLEIDKSRFDGCFGYQANELHPDENKHILAFDILYCYSVYNLFKGINYGFQNTKEKQKYMENKSRAEQLLEKYQAAQKELAEFTEQLSYFVEKLSVGAQVRHNAFGAGEVVGAGENRIEIFFPERNEKKAFALTALLANHLISTGSATFSRKNNLFIPLLKKESLIRNEAIRAERELASYEEYLD